MIEVELIEAVRRGKLILFDTCVLIELWLNWGTSGGRFDMTRVPTPLRAVATPIEWDFLRARDKPVAEYHARHRWIRDFFPKRLRLRDGVDTALQAMLPQNRAIELPDALVAASCVSQGAPLLTFNVKHFTEILGLTLVRM